MYDECAAAQYLCEWNRDFCEAILGRIYNPSASSEETLGNKAIKLRITKRNSMKVFPKRFLDHALGIDLADSDSMNRGDLTNEQWARFQPLLPPEKPQTGRPNLDHRCIINGILWILCTGAPWEDVPSRYSTRGTVSSRFYWRRKVGIWDRIFADLQAHVDADGTLDWAMHFVDSTSCVPISTQLVQKGGPNDQGIGPQPRRLLDQVECPRRRCRPAIGLCPSAGPAARKSGL